MTKREFLRQQGRRLWLRAYVVLACLTALAFWTLFLSLGQWLVATNLATLWFILVILWVFIVTPVMLLQARWILDVLFFAGTGRTTYYREDKKLVEQTGEWFAQLNPPQQQRLVRIARIAALIGNTSPLSGLGLWALIVLERMPDEAHERMPESRRQLREVFRMGRAEEERVVREFAGRALRWAS